MSLLTSCGSHDLLASASALCLCPQRITVLVGKPFSLKELAEALRAENKSQVRTVGAALTGRVSAATTEEEIQRAAMLMFSTCSSCSDSGHLSWR